MRIKDQTHAHLNESVKVTAVLINVVLVFEDKNENKLKSESNFSRTEVIH